MGKALDFNPEISIEEKKNKTQKYKEWKKKEKVFNKFFNPKEILNTTFKLFGEVSEISLKESQDFAEEFNGGERHYIKACDSFKITTGTNVLIWNREKGICVSE